jgi:hypothetical protein
MSNSTADFQRILATSPSADKQGKIPIRADSNEENEEEKRKTAGNRGKRGFLGTLDAAIVYFGEGQRGYSAMVEGRDGEVGQLKEEMEQLQLQIEAFERRNEELKAQNERLISQREVVSRSIGSLNTQILDLELQLKERKSPVPPLSLPSRTPPKLSDPFNQRPGEVVRLDKGAYGDKAYRPTDSQATRPSRTEDNSKDEIDSF